MERPRLRFPVSRLDDVLIACDPKQPLDPGDPRYADFSGLRQGAGLASIRRRLLLSPGSGSFHLGCVCGHRGCGKSTELLALKEWADQQGFLALHVETDTHLGLIPLEFSDLFLLAATVVEDGLKRLDCSLPERKVRRVVEWFSEVTQTQRGEVKSELAAEAGAQLGGSAPFGLGKLFARFTAGVKAGTEYITEARRQIRNYPHQLIDMTNDLLSEANRLLAGNGRPRGVLILFDNLDRYEPGQIHRVLFSGSTLVRSMACHALFTIPIDLEYQPPSGAIQDHYGFSTVLPMLALRRKREGWGESVAESAFDDDAVGEVRVALGRRIDINVLFEDPNDVDLLVKMSGGCVRDLMHLVTEAFAHTEDDARVTRGAVQTAIGRMRATYARRLTSEDYQRLAEIARRVPVARDERTGRLLFHRFALEYLDDADQPWVDVHPLVVETEEFRSAYGSSSNIARA